MLGLLLTLGLARTHSGRHRRVPILSNSDTGVVTSDNGINIRSGPGTSYSIIGGVPYGGRVTILGDGGNNFWKIQYGGISGYGTKDYIRVESSGSSYTAYVSSTDGLHLRSGPGTSYSSLGVMPYRTQITVLQDMGNGWVKATWGSTTGYCSSEYISKSTPSGTVIRQGDSRFNSNIRQWGCAFMSCCWCGGINSIDGCNAQYNRAVSNGWMRSDCYINNWDSMKNVAGAKSYRYASKGEYPASNQKEVLECHYGSSGMHFVVGNGKGGIEYDPAYDGFVSYSQCTSKRFYTY